MSFWPEGMTVDPIGEWPGALTRNRTVSQFSSTLGSSQAILQRELRALAAKNVRLQIAIPPEKFTVAGKPYANAVPAHPGLILTLESKHGPLSYPCDTFTRWQDNLRAIALALEALRKVDRYGVTKRGEQYRGFLALEATAVPAGIATVDEAIDFLMSIDGVRTEQGDHAATILRRAQRVSHPDRGGDPAIFQRVSLAEQKLREAGLL